MNVPLPQAATWGRAWSDPVVQGGRRLAVLDGYRGVAILTVMAYHYTVRWAAPSDPADHFPAGAVFNDITPLHYGWMGVQLFFIVSGFVILMTLEHCRGLVDFACRRAARLWPPMLVAATVTALVLTLAGPLDWRPTPTGYLSSLFFIDPGLAGRLLHRPAAWVDGVYWTLWTEVRFYGLAALVFLVARGRFLPAWLVLQVLALALTLGLTGEDRTVLGLVLLPDALPYFTLGLCSYRLFMRRDVRLAWLGAGLAVEAIAWHVLADAPDATKVDCTRMGMLIGNGLILLLMLAFVTGSRLSRIFAAPALVTVGRSSYSLYLIHQSLGVMVLRSLTDRGVPALLGIVVVSAVVIALSRAMFHVIEMPARDWVHSRTRGLVSAADHRFLWQRYPGITAG